MPDPLDDLRLPATPIAPDPAFADRLRARVEAALAPDPADPSALPAIRLRPEEATVSDTAATTIHALTPYLAVADAAAALDWYRDVLGALETTRFVGDDGTIGHAEVVIGGATLMLADEWPDGGVYGPTHHGGTSVTLHLVVVDVDHTFGLAVDHGAEVERAPSDQFHGSRNAVVRDPFGHRWMLSQPISADRAEQASGDGAADQGFAVTGRPPVEPGYITMQTRDLSRAQAFYGALFSWAIEPGSQEGGGHIANTRFPMGFVQVEDPAATSPVTLYFRVDDIERYATRVEELGGRVLARATYPSGGNAECVDDQGFRFDLFRPAPGY
jgi:uncharacterized glyoxalase superfamily protein PhnB